MKKILLATMVVIILLGSSFTVLAKPLSEKGNSNGEEKKLAALVKIKEKLIERKGYNPEDWPPGLSKLLFDYGLLR